MITVFIAGPYNDDAPLAERKANVDRAMQAAHELLIAGFYPYVPHLSHFLHENQPLDRTIWLSLSNAFMQLCDCVLRLPGESPGSDEEVRGATAAGKPVFWADITRNVSLTIADMAAVYFGRRLS